MEKCLPESRLRQVTIGHSSIGQSQSVLQEILPILDIQSKLDQALNSGLFRSIGQPSLSETQVNLFYQLLTTMSNATLGLQGPPLHSVLLDSFHLALTMITSSLSLWGLQRLTTNSNWTLQPLTISLLLFITAATTESTFLHQELLKQTKDCSS